jgi:hypothetical protein
MSVSGNNWELEPFDRVGAFKLGSDVNHYIDTYELSLRPIESDNPEDFTFDIGETDSFLRTDYDKHILSVTCEDECRYKGVNLIGKPLEDVELLLQAKAVYDDQMCDQEIYVIDQLGLMLWVDDGIVVTVNCSIYIDPDEVD